MEGGDHHFSEWFTVRRKTAGKGSVPRGGVCGLMEINESAERTVGIG